MLYSKVMGNECITADYGLMENGEVSVLNSQINRKGELDTIGGYAYIKELLIVPLVKLILTIY